MMRLFQLLGWHVLVVFPDVGNVVFLAEVIGKKRDTEIQKIAGFDNPGLCHFVESALFGKALEHGHEIGRVRGLCPELDLLRCLLLSVFPLLFHKE